MMAESQMLNVNANASTVRGGAWNLQLAASRPPISGSGYFCARNPSVHSSHGGGRVSVRPRAWPVQVPTSATRAVVESRSGGVANALLEAPMALPSVVDFDGQPIEVVDHENRPWMRVSQIATALGANRSSLTDTYRRHRAEFTDRETAVITLPTNRGHQRTRIFSPRGAWLLAMLARTEKAAAFRRWVVDVLDGLGTEPAIPKGHITVSRFALENHLVETHQFADELRDWVAALDRLRPDHTLEERARKRIMWRVRDIVEAVATGTQRRAVEMAPDAARRIGVVDDA